MDGLPMAYLRLTAWVVLPILAGVGLRRVGVPRIASRWLFSSALFVFQTSISVLAVWVARLDRAAALLPLATLAGWCLAATLGWLGSRALRHEPRQRGAFIMAMCMSNHGYTLLGIAALLLFGEAGLAQATYAQLLFVPFIVLFCFPAGRFYGEGQGRLAPGELVRRSVRDVRNLPLAAMAVGLALNLAGVPRPAACAPLLRWLVCVGTVVSGVAIGLQFEGLGIRRYWRENALSLAFRSTLYPAFFAAAAWCLDMGALDTRVLVLYGLVPSALFSNLVADLFDLDTDLTNSVFMVGTALFLLAVLPTYAVLARMPA